MTENKKLTVAGINGPVVTILGRTGLEMLEMVYVGRSRLVGEVIAITDERTTIQVYENTAGLRPGEEIISTGAPIRCMLAPGLIGGIYDGIGRPLDKLEAKCGCFLLPGVDAPTVDTEKIWQIDMKIKPGDIVSPGVIFAECDETSAVRHRMIVPEGISGEVIFAADSGEHRVEDILLKIKGEDGEAVSLSSVVRHPIRIPRPVASRLEAGEPLITGQRIIDTLFPIAKGGAAAIPGGFGTGKTMLQHQLAKWSGADIIVYVGCGERGNEMTQVLEEFSELIDPKTGRSMLERTVLIANTSNMPVAAREASIYTGVTIAEYYRDMGYNVALMADSTSRWAEALREISGRLEEMPAEEGFPAYLPSRLSAFYERAGMMKTLSGANASVSIIGAVSPQGNDFSEPVTQNTKRFIRCFWALDKSLAYSRHYPAVNWINSYSEYTGELTRWYRREVADDFMQLRGELVRILGEEDRLMEIVKLIGSDLLANEQKLILEIARCIRVGFLQQDAFAPDDMFVPIRKQYLHMKYLVELYRRAGMLAARQVPMSTLAEAGVFDRFIKLKYEVPNSNPDKILEIWGEVSDTICAIEAKYSRS